MSLFISVDFPTLGFPMIFTKPALCICAKVQVWGLNILFTFDETNFQMKKLFLLFIFFLIRFFNSFGQNLVPNGDFEQYSGCPNTGGQLDSALFWMNPSTNLWMTGSPDYYNQCAGNNFIGVPNNWCGFQPSHSGVAYGGIYIWSLLPLDSVREYLETPLTFTLSANTCYHFEMYVNLGDLCKFTTADIGVYFSDTAVTGINNYYPLAFAPQISNSTVNILDSSSWTLISGNYTASGSENFLIIGNFKDDINTTATMYNSNSQGSFIYAYIDDVSLTPCTGIEEQNANQEIKIYPNPVEEELQVSGLRFLVGEKAEIKITDILGKEIYRNYLHNSIFHLPTSNFQAGIYFLEINSRKNIFREKFLKE